MARTGLCLQYEVTALHSLGQGPWGLHRRAQGLSLPLQLQVSAKHVGTYFKMVVCAFLTIDGNFDCADCWDFILVGFYTSFMFYSIVYFFLCFIEQLKTAVQFIESIIKRVNQEKNVLRLVKRVDVTKNMLGQ